jgi:hypothetical protein
MRFHRTVHAVLVSALTLCAFATGSVSRAAEFLYDNGVIFNGATSAVLQIIDVLPAQKVGGDPTTFERVGDAFNVYVRVVLEPGTPSSEQFVAGADLGPMPDAKQFTVNYYLATRVPGGTYGEFQLRKSEPLVILTYLEMRPVVEYYHAELKHYFQTGNYDEQMALDTGVYAGWARTGVEWLGYMAAGPTPPLSPVCRFYGVPSAGLDTHFYSVNPAECAYVAQTWPDKWIEETPRAFDVLHLSPESGRCASGTLPVIRFWNAQFDVNHRYVATKSAEAEMVAKGWIQEGRVWCARLLHQ